MIKSTNLQITIWVSWYVF